MKNIYFIAIALFLSCYIIIEVRKKRLSIKESFWWMSASVVMLLLSIFPHIIDKIAEWFGVFYAPSLLFVFCIVFLVYINFRNVKKIASQQEKITELAQRVALLEAEVYDKEK